jgi:hypothetical protein
MSFKYSPRKSTSEVVGGCIGSIAAAFIKAAAGAWALMAGLNALHVAAGFWACVAICVALSIATSHERGDES